MGETRIDFSHREVDKLEAREKVDDEKSETRLLVKM